MSKKTNDLIQELDMRMHPEGGWFRETDRQVHKISTPFLAGATRSLSSSMYYLLSFENPSGHLHMNNSVIYHILHHGRAEYTVIRPGNPPTVEKTVLGTDSNAGETRVLVVNPGVWKMSRLLPQDVKLACSINERETLNCLITEIVVPAFEWEDHKFMTKDELIKLFDGCADGDNWIKSLMPFVVM